MAILAWRCLAGLTSFASLVAGSRSPSSDDLACATNRPEWRAYYEAYEKAAHATAFAGDDSRLQAEARAALAQALLDRTENVSDVLSCNVGVIAGYYLLSRLVSPVEVESLGQAGGSAEGKAGLAYRLLQMALIWIFTLRNGNKIPFLPGRSWGIHESQIIPAIMEIKKGHDRRLRHEQHSVVPISPSFRDPDLNIAIVSICAYPEDHPIALPKVTPPNRDAYARRHGYAARVHMERPIIGAPDLGMQHAKLATVLAYLQTGEFDWVAWFDCDSIIMNMNRTLDSVIYQYTQVSATEEDLADPEPVCGSDETIDISGNWSDSWIPEDMRKEARISIRLTRATGDVVATAPQIGEVRGRLESLTLSLDFPDGSLSGTVIESGDDGLKLEWENGAEWHLAGTRQRGPCREPCRAPGPDCAAVLDSHKDLLITEEGWGLSSANWLIKRSAWSMEFLNNALTSAHVELPLFGDQDGMIYHLMNEQTLRTAAKADAHETVFWRDPLDQHGATVPQFELNSYDALNALTMDCDAFVEGDLLITFPQCKDADGCNDVFELAADYAKADDEDKLLEGDAGAWWRRFEGPPRWSGYERHSGASLRVFGPRPVIREVFLRQQAVDK
eukprot:TRINITY_DN76768_c0_g1_i1.p1 TRINITY_DN76768_c0_g1~~TRINITY_DN76768_c0_g1_i1.p1  ORF type:complete len:616 (-),score=47.00 TRINITY_DN76768_c0_g1_i1:74-1921(-)